MNWMKNLETFLAVVEAGSFNKAADKLYTSVSSVSKRITWLEEALGTQLIKRSTKELRLTDSGSRLYEKAGDITNAWQELKMEVGNNNPLPQGELTIGYPQLIGKRYVVNLIHGYLAKYPDVSINTRICNNLSSMNEEHLDIYFASDRYGQDNDHLVAHPVETIHRQLFAAPGYIEQHPEIKKPEDLVNHNCLINARYNDGNIWQLNDEKIEVSGNFRSNDAQSMLNMATSGAGVLWTFPNLIQDEIAAGHLVAVLPEHRSPDLTICAYFQKSRFTPKTIRTFLDFLDTQVKPARDEDLEPAK